MLLEPPNQLLLLVALGGPIGPVGPIETVESNGISTELYGEFQYNWCRNACRRHWLLLLLQLLRVLHSRVDLWALEIDPDASAGDPNRFEWKKRCPLF